MLKYTICFIRSEHHLLMLNRQKSPNMGLWNGVGGKIEKGESPRECILRETYEETGIALPTVTYAGNVIWKSDKGEAGMYVFVADLPTDSHPQTLVHTREGILDWKDIDWILDAANKGVVDNVKRFLPAVWSGHYNLEHSFCYKDGVLIDYATQQLNLVEVSFSIGHTPAMRGGES